MILKFNPKLQSIPAAIMLLLLFLTACAETETEKINREFKEFVTQYEQKVIPLYQKYNEAAYNAAVSGDENQYKLATEYKIMLSKIHSNKESFKKLEYIKNSKLISDTILARELDELYNLFLPNQIEEGKLVEIITLENEVRRKFNTFRPEIDGNIVSVNKIEEVLRTSTNEEELKQYWEASKRVGNIVSQDLIQLVKKRNEAAKELGFANYYEMILKTNGQDPEEIENIFDDLDMLTRGPYMQLKEEIDAYLSEKYNTEPDRLMPWHYQNRFFQKAPVIYNINFNKFYKNIKPVDVVKKYFKGIGLNIDDALNNSDLYPKERKSQLAYTTDIDRKGTVRILANIENSQSSMTTLLYESGFAAYLKYIDKDLPFTLHKPPQFAANDAIATLFSSFSSNIGWIEKMLGVSEKNTNKFKDASLKQLRLEKFVFARWAQVMYRFERELYDNPDQDLNTLWWDLVERYQLLNRPPDRDAHDWATKTHLITMPCTYHNYMLGELIASQIHFYVKQNILKDDGSACDTKCIDNPDVGKYMIEKLFKPGAKYDLNQWLKNSTGETLSPDFYTNQYIKIK
ncbi:MAG: M2 family metallopeptidase [Bacteroidales bacterium]|nr:M2 family metallopeptidase [Bacteroidales bacterium]